MSSAMPRPPDPATLERLKAIVGPGGFVDDPSDLAPYLKEWRNRYHGRTSLVLRPDSAEQVAALVRICAEADVAIVPQGGNTGLQGGQIPRAEGHDLLLSLGRMNRVRAIDPLNNTIIVEAGATLAQVQAAAAEVDRLFPLSLAAEGSCQIGGNLSTNAGGIHVLRYGNSRDLVLGLEVVTPQGDLWNGLRGLRKDNTGYDLKQLYVGAEGTLGIITAAVLKLFPRHRHVETIFAAVPDVQAAVSLLARVRSDTHDAVLAFELICRPALEFVTRHMPGTSDPLSRPADWYVLFDLTASRALTEEALTEATMEGLISDAVLARNPAEGGALWRLREGISEAQKPEGGSLKHDIAVPVSRIPELVDQVTAAVTAAVPGIRPVPFGHVGDGNLHFNFSQPIGADARAFLAAGPQVHRIVHDITAALGGSISAEHGIGVSKREEIRRYKSPLEIALMQRIKQALDPQGIMNPGKGVV
jgi:FAD/FMN-containing dehydrogenase